MNRLFRVTGQAIVTIVWLVAAFFKSLWEAECEIFDGGKSDREFLEAMRILDQRYEDMNVADREKYRELMRRTV